MQTPSLAKEFLHYFGIRGKTTFQRHGAGPFWQTTPVTRHAKGMPESSLPGIYGILRHFAFLLQDDGLTCSPLSLWLEAFNPLYGIQKRHLLSFSSGVRKGHPEI
jgi:hypothetical protein